MDSSQQSTTIGIEISSFTLNLELKMKYSDKMEISKLLFSSSNQPSSVPPKTATTEWASFGWPDRIGWDESDKQTQGVDISTNHGNSMFRYSPSLLLWTVNYGSCTSGIRHKRLLTVWQLVKPIVRSR